MSVEQKIKGEFVYKPEGAPEQRWPFAPARMSNKESVLIERLTGWTFLEWQDQFFAGSVQAAHAVLWVLLRRKAPTLDPDAVEFMFEEYGLEYSDQLGRRVNVIGQRIDEDGNVLPEGGDDDPSGDSPAGSSLVALEKHAEAAEEGKDESAPTSDSVDHADPLSPEL